MLSFRGGNEGCLAIAKYFDDLLCFFAPFLCRAHWVAVPEGLHLFASEHFARPHLTKISVELATAKTCYVGSCVASTFYDVLT